MFDIVLAVFLFFSHIFINILGIGNLNALQFYQFGFIGNNNSIAQLQFFQYGIVALFIISLFCKPEREFNDKYSILFLALCFISVFLYPKTIGNFASIFLGFLLYY